MNGGHIISEGILWHPKLTRAALKSCIRHMRSKLLTQQVLELHLNPMDKLQPNEEVRISRESNVKIHYDREVPRGSVWCPGRSVS